MELKNGRMRRITAFVIAFTCSAGHSAAEHLTSLSCSALGRPWPAADQSQLLFKDMFDTPSIRNGALYAYDTRFSDPRVNRGEMVVPYLSAQNSPPAGIECVLPKTAVDPDERFTSIRFGGGGTEMSNSLFISYALGPGPGFCLPPLPGVSIPNLRSGYIIRFIRHGDGTNEVKFYRSDTGWIKELRNDWTLPANPVSALRHVMIRHRRTGEHLITAVFDTGTPFEKSYAFTDDAYRPGNAQRSLQFIAKGHSPTHTSLQIVTDSWIVHDITGIPPAGSPPPALAGPRRKDDGDKKKGMKKQEPPRNIDVDQQMASARTLYDQGDFVSARDICLRILDQSPDVDDALDLLGLAEISLTDFSAANTHLRRALEIRKKTRGPEHLKVADSLIHLAGIHAGRDPFEGMALYQEALDIRTRALGPDHRDVAGVLIDLAGLASASGNFPAAETSYLRAISIYEKVGGPDHADVAEALTKLAWLYLNGQKRPSDAAPIYLRIISIHEKAKDTDSLQMAHIQHTLAELYRKQGNVSEAEPLYKRVMAIRESQLGPGHPDVARAAQMLGYIYRAQKRYAAAESVYLRALGIYEKTLGPDHPETASVLNGLANLYGDLGQFKKADDLYRRSLSIMEKNLGPDHPFLVKIMENMSQLYKRMDRPKDAGDYEGRARAIREKNRANK